MDLYPHGSGDKRLGDLAGKPIRPTEHHPLPSGESSRPNDDRDAEIFDEGRVRVLMVMSVPSSDRPTLRRARQVTPCRTLGAMRILITGAARAIGAATAAELIRSGHEVVATARDVTLLDQLDVSQRLTLDVTDEESIRSALSRAGELDAIVNNAALSGKGPLEDFPLDRLTAMFDTNTLGPLRLVQQVVPAWRLRGSGVIVNVSSIQGRVSTPLEGPYSASKYALESLSETLHYELGHFGIRTVIIEPGYIGTGMKAAEPHTGDPVYAGLWEQWDGTDAKVNGPQGRPGPELVAVAIRRAIEDPTTPLRVPVGDDAAMVLGARSQLDDPSFEKAMRDVLGITW